MRDQGVAAVVEDPLPYPLAEKIAILDPRRLFEGKRSVDLSSRSDCFGSLVSDVWAAAPDPERSPGMHWRRTAMAQVTGAERYRRRYWFRAINDDNERAVSNLADSWYLPPAIAHPMRNQSLLPQRSVAPRINRGGVIGGGPLFTPTAGGGVPASPAQVTTAFCRRWALHASLPRGPERPQGPRPSPASPTWPRTPRPSSHNCPRDRPASAPPAQHLATGWIRRTIITQSRSCWPCSRDSASYSPITASTYAATSAGPDRVPVPNATRPVAR